MLFYVYGFIHIGFHPKEDMDVSHLIYWLREGFGPPDGYLGVNVEKL